MDFLTADEHVRHINKDGNRSVLTMMPARAELFTDVYAMEEEFVYRHNAVVRPQDRVFHMGDVSFKYEGHVEYIPRLNGQHFLIKGNHDRTKQLIKKGHPYAWIKDVHMLKGEQMIWLAHYAHQTWPQAHYGVMHAFGHSHGKLGNVFGRKMDVGVDSHDYAPISVDEFRRRLDTVSYYMEDRDVKF